ncbi:hypothetical protein MJ3_11130, partial [Salimicrobium jeotgali]
PVRARFCRVRQNKTPLRQSICYARESSESRSRTGRRERCDADAYLYPVMSTQSDGIDDFTDSLAELLSVKSKVGMVRQHYDKYDEIVLVSADQATTLPRT